MRVLGVDYGLKKTGLALAETKLAEPLAVIKSPSLAEKILKICQELAIERVVIGLPEGDLVSKIKKLKTALERSGLQVFCQDETLTSQEAIGKMIAIGKKRKFRQKKQDAVAAALILQAYLDRQNKDDV